MARPLLFSKRTLMGNRTDNPIPDGPAPPPVRGMQRSGRRSTQAGIALVQVIIAMGMIALCGAAGLRALIEMNRKAAAMRTLSQARAIVQRNIDSAMGVTFNASLCPGILALTSGSTYDDDGGGDNLVNVSVGRSGNSVVKGTLTRTVTAVANPDNADIRKITFNLSYTYRLKTYNFAMTTIRAMD